MASPTTSNGKNNSPLSPNSLLGLFPHLFSSLPSAPPAKPYFRAPHDLLAALYHAAMVAVGFKFAGLGEEGPPASSDVDAHAAAPLPETWNASEAYAFRYTHPQSQMTFVVKAVKLANKMIIHGMGIEDNKVATLEIAIPEFVVPNTPATFPYPGASSPTATTTTTTTPADSQLSVDALLRLFTSAAAFEDLVTRYKVNIVQKLVPGLHKPGYQEERGAESTSTERGERVRDRDQGPRHRHPDYNNNNDDNDDDHPLREPGIGGRGRGGRHPHAGPALGRWEPHPIGGGGPLSIGSRDLDPLASMGGYVDPRRGLAGIGDGGGMLVGPEHPMFYPPGGRPGGGLGGGGSGGAFGGPQPLPPGAVPPGARFDPIGPFGPPRGGPGRRPGQPGSGRGVFGGDPDFDDLPPPGTGGFGGDNMFM